MNSLLALTVSSFLDILRRPSTKVLAAIGVVSILSLRYFAAFGLGYEVNQLKELSVYTAGLLAVVAAVLFVLPSEDEDASSMLQVLTRPVPVWRVSLGMFLGRFVVIGGLIALCAAVTYAALQWFQLSEPRLFGYRGASSALEELQSTLWPFLGQWLGAGVFLALIMPISRSRLTAVITAAGLGIYMLGYSAASLGTLAARILPDLSRYDLTSSLWDNGPVSGLLTVVIHALAWITIGILADSLALRLPTS